jgi:hypothetical protein
MPYCTPAIPIERLPPTADNTPTLVCLCCGDTMERFRTIRELGVFPERHIFVCPSCKGVDTKDVKRVRKGASVGTL